MGKKLYVGNLPYTVTDQILADAFGECGTVTSANIIMDRESGRSKGFGFVEMGSDNEAAEAITKYNGADWEGRAMNVSEAKPRENTRGGGGGGGGGDRGGRW